MIGLGKFYVKSDLETRRANERRNCFDLLWENIQDGSWSELEQISGRTLSDKEKIEKQVSHWCSTMAQFFIIVSVSINLVSDKNVRDILQFGAARRIGSVRLSIGIIMDIAPPDRLKRLSRDESSEVTSAMLVFYVHLGNV